jgi:hypothetical protein
LAFRVAPLHDRFAGQNVMTLSSNRHHVPASLVEHDLFRKPASTFRGMLTLAGHVRIPRETQTSQLVHALQRGMLRRAVLRHRDGSFCFLLLTLSE